MISNYDRIIEITNQITSEHTIRKTQALMVAAARVDQKIYTWLVSQGLDSLVYEAASFEVTIDHLKKYLLK